MEREAESPLQLNASKKLQRGRAEKEKEHVPLFYIGSPWGPQQHVPWDERAKHGEGRHEDKGGLAAS